MPSHGRVGFCTSGGTQSVADTNTPTYTENAREKGKILEKIGVKSSKFRFEKFGFDISCGKKR